LEGSVIKLKTILSRAVASSEDGQALVEYALIIGSIALFAVGSLQLLGTDVNALLSQVAAGFPAP
jgi:Flp pilus assembly pilin Flp